MACLWGPPKVSDDPWVLSGRSIGRSGGQGSVGRKVGVRSVGRDSAGSVGRSVEVRSVGRSSFGQSVSWGSVGGMPDWHPTGGPDWR